MNHLNIKWPQFFRFMSTRVSPTQWISAMDLKARGPEHVYSTVFFFSWRKGYINLRQEYYKFSSNAHRSLASTVGSALGLGAGGLEHVYSAFFFSWGGGIYQRNTRILEIFLKPSPQSG